MKKIKDTMMMIVGFFIITVTSANPAVAEVPDQTSNTESGEQELNQEDIEALETINQHTSFSEETEKIQVTEKETLKTALSPYDNFSFEELEKGISEYNSIVAGKQGKEAKKELENALVKVSEETGTSQSNSNTNPGMITTQSCSDWLTAIGFGHTTSVSVVAAVLGISNPAAVAVATSMGAIYTGGSIACPN